MSGDYGGRLLKLYYQLGDGWIWVKRQIHNKLDPVIGPETCPVCFYYASGFEPAHFNVCPCCGTEFDLDDYLQTYRELRRRWLDSGAQFWYAPKKPAGWSARAQLALYGWER